MAAQEEPRRSPGEAAEGLEEPWEHIAGRSQENRKPSRSPAAVQTQPRSSPAAAQKRPRSSQEATRRSSDAS